MKLIFLLTLALSVYASEKKVYTQKEFDEKLKVKLEKEINRIKKKSIAKLTKEVLEKEEALAQREIDLDRKFEQIKVAEKTLSQKIQSFEKQQEKVLGCISENKNKAKKRIQGLVSMISNMKPLKAADILSVQDSEISIKILENIDPKRASKIFNLMDKEVSARLQKEYLNMRR